MKLLLFALFCCAPLMAQKDFLTADEVDQIREAQDPNDRLKLYTLFAKQRIDQILHLMKEQKPGRAGMVHDLLDEYGKIVDAMDSVTDDALERKLDVSIGVKSVASAEKDFLPQLEKIRDGNPPDLARYEFVLTQAIEATSDSMDLAGQDLGKRTTEVADREKREKKSREAMMQPKDLEEKKAAAAKEANADVNKRKKPSLLKKGEAAKEQ